MTPPRIRPLVRDDCPRLVPLLDQLGYASGEPDLRRRLETLADSRDHAVFVAEGKDGELLGFVHVKAHLGLLSDPAAELAALAVDRGTRRNGVGAALVQFAETWARERGLARMVVRSNIARDEAHPFYLARGYAASKTQQVYSKPLGTPGTGR